MVDEQDATEDRRHTEALAITRIQADLDSALKVLAARLPVFVYFNNYFRVRPNLHLELFARRIEQDILDDDRFDFGNLCLLKLLGFTARELADLGSVAEPSDSPGAFETFRKQLDERSIKLNAASVRLQRDSIRLESEPRPS